MATAVVGEDPAASAQTKLLIAIAAGSAVSVFLGVYGSVHEGTGHDLFTFFFDQMIQMKVWLTSLAMALALTQLGSALMMYGKIPSLPNSSGWLGQVHRLSGTLALLFSLPVAFHCLWSLGFNKGAGDTRVLVHSIAGCFVYGAYVAKVTGVRLHGLPGWVLPLLGGSVFSAFVLIWVTSSFWWLSNTPVSGWF